MPLTASANLSTMRLAAGEPLVVQLSTDGDPASRAFVMSVFGPGRVVQDTIDGIYNGGLFEFLRSGSWSEGLYGKTGLKVEIAERLNGGKYVLASPSLTVDISANNTPGANNSVVARSAVLVTVTTAATGLPVVAATQIPYISDIEFPPVYLMDFRLPKNAAYLGATL